MKNNGDANNNPKLVIFLGILFTLGGTFGFIKIVGSFDTLFLFVSLLLMCVGVYSIFYGISRARKLKKYKQLLNDPTAYMTTAYFVKSVFASYTSKSVGMNDVDIITSMNVYKKIKYRYTDENGIEHTAKSELSYTPNQVKYLKELGQFRIKCKGAASVIIEEVPAQNPHFNL